MSNQAKISDDRLAQICDGIVTAFDYEAPMMAAELLARRAADRQQLRAEIQDATHKGPPIDGGKFSRR